MNFLCAVIQEGWSVYQVLTEATQHNIPLRIIHLSCFHGFVTEPQSDDGSINAFLKKIHSYGVAPMALAT